MSKNQKQASLMLSLDRNVWMDGPELPNNANFNHANGIVLNRTAVLFIGVGYLPFQVDAFSERTVIYNFDLNQWTWQESLPFESASNHVIIHSLQTSSVIFHEKGYKG